jgi:hypothetical protein
MLAPRLYRALGCEVEELYCEVDGPLSQPPSRPFGSQESRGTDPDGEARRRGLGIRLRRRRRSASGLVTKDGEIIFADRQLMLLAKDVLSRNPGAQIIYDVKSTRLLAPWIEKHGGKPLIWKTGHSLIKAKLKETGALLAGEMSGHTFFKERWYGFDDALYGGARLLEILSKEKDPNRTLKSLPNAPSTPELHWGLSEGEPHALVAKLQASKPFPGAERIVTIDGVRVEYADGFGLAPRLEHHAGHRAALRGRFRRRPRADQEGFPQGAATPEAECASSLLACFSSQVTSWLARVCSTARWKPSSRSRSRSANTPARWCWWSIPPASAVTRRSTTAWKRSIASTRRAGWWCSASR